MTYAMNGFGAFENCESFYSGGIDYCLGYERSCPDHEKCCPPDSWYNAVYAALKGKMSLRRQNEEKVRHAMALLIAPTSSGFATGIEQAAYDAGVPLSPQLVERVVTAATTFDLVFPRERFRYSKTKEKAPVHPLGSGVRQCGGNDKRYSGYYLEPYWPEARIVALEALTGASFTPAQREQLTRGGLAAEGEASDVALPGLPAPLPAPADVASKFAQVSAIVSSCPGCRQDDHRDRMPSVGELVTISPRAGVQLSPWAESFVSELSPKQPLASRFPNLAGKLPTPPNLRLPWRPPTELNEEGGSGRGVPGQSGGAKGSGGLAKAAGVAAVGLVAGYVLYRAVT
jgi:hypothetical protein